MKGSDAAVASWSSVRLIYSCSEECKIHPIKRCMAELHFAFWVFLIYFAAFPIDMPQLAWFNLLVKPTCAEQFSSATAFVYVRGVIQRCCHFLLGRVSKFLFFLLSSWLFCFESVYFSNAYSNSSTLPGSLNLWPWYRRAGYFCMDHYSFDSIWVSCFLIPLGAWMWDLLSRRKRK